MYVPLTGSETTKVRPRIVTYLVGRGLDIGAGEDPVLPAKAQSEQHSCLTVDLYNPTAALRTDAKDLSMLADESFDYVYSSHCLEDFYYWQAVVREWWRLVKVDGVLILYLPLTKKVARSIGLENWEDFYPNIGDEGERNLDHRTDFVPQELRDFILTLSPAEVEVDEIRNTKDDQEYSFLLVIRKTGSVGLPAISKPKTNGKTIKRALVIRYGAFGDIIMSTPILRLLKEQGYDKVDFNCTHYGVEVLKHNPYVDEILLQARNAMPIEQLPKLNEELAKRYDRICNLTGAAEDKLLIADGSAFKIMNSIRQQMAENVTDHDIFLAVIKIFRKQFGDKNYYDSHLEKAGFDERGLNGELYFSDIEHRMAHDFLHQHKGQYLILWSLSGSAIHKIYPYFYQTVQGILKEVPNAFVVSVGDLLCRFMEPPPSARYLPRADDWSIRMSMLMTKYADLVIGPETGVLNAAGCFDTPKITLRSHSSHANLCKYWVNDFCMEPDPEKVPCYPCHMIHHSELSCLTGRVIDPGVASGLRIPTDKKSEKEWHHPICMSWGVKPEQIVAKVAELREKFGLRNPKTFSVQHNEELDSDYLHLPSGGVQPVSGHET